VFRVRNIKTKTKNGGSKVGGGEKVVSVV